MPSFRSLGNKFFGKTIGEAAAFALGGAMRSPLEPPLAELTNETWSKFVDAGVTLPLEPGDVADIAAEDVATVPWAKQQAKQTGIGGDQMDKLIGAALNAPSVSELYALWRRNLITKAQFEHGLRKAKLETLWDKPLEAAHDVLLSSEELAMMQQQGFVDDTRANTEAALQGVTSERQQLRFEASGLPPGVSEALEMLRRGIIDAGTFAQIVREGHTKTKYTDDLLRLKDRVLNATTYVGLFLRGWITRDAMNAGGELTGYSPEQMDMMWKDHGRPATTHQVHIGYARGGRYDGENLDERETFQRAVLQSDIRPEWEPILWAQRYSYPAAFVVRALAQAGDLTEAETDEILRFQGWEPTLAATVAKRWAGAKTSAAKEATATDLLALYDGEHATETETLAALEDLGYPPDEARLKLDVLSARKVASSRTTAISDLHGLFKKSDITLPQAVAAVAKLGLTPDDAARIVANWNVVLTSAG